MVKNATGKQTLFDSASDTPPDNEELTLDHITGVIDQIVESYEGVKGALIPVLQTTQNLLGYLPEQALKYIGKKLEISYSEIAGVVTFYSFFTIHPRGKHLIRVCLGTACYVRGGKQVLETFERELGIHVGETTTDKLFSLEVGRCFGACGLAPVVMVDEEVFQRVKPDAIKHIIQTYKHRETLSQGNNTEEEVWKQPADLKL